MKHFLIILFIFALVGCGERMNEQDFFNQELYPVKQVDRQKRVPVLVSDIPFNPYFSIIYKDYCICYEQDGDYFISANDLRNGDLVKGILRHGRGPYESTMIHPIFSVRNGCINLFDYDRTAFFNVDIEYNIKHGVDSVKKFYTINAPDASSFVPFSHFALNDSTVILYNTALSLENPDASEQDPYYGVFDTQSGIQMRRFDVFNRIVPSDYQESFTPQSYLNIFDCVNPEGDRLFFGMAFLPVYGMLDLVSGDVRVYKIDGLKSFNTRKERFQFVSAACSSDKVYALYSGAVGVEKLMTRRTDLYVFDWEGNITDRLILDKAYKYVSVSDGKVYLMDYDGYVYTVE